MRVKDVVGRYGEQVAVEHLQAAGFEVLERNWRCREGEVDIVARDGTELVFVEVKTRSSAAFGTPAEAVHPRKADRIRGLAVRWLLQQRERGEPAFWSVVRFDVVSVVRGAGPAGPDVDHVKAAF